jgi:hypothetical protein
MGSSSPADRVAFASGHPLLLKHVFHQDYREKIPEVLRLLRELIEKKTGMQYIETMLRYIFRNSGDTIIIDISRNPCQYFPMVRMARAVAVGFPHHVTQ